MIDRKSRFWIQIVSIILITFVVAFNLYLVFRIDNVNKMTFVAQSVREVETVRTNTIDDVISAILSRMSPEEKIGQLVVVNYYGNDWNRIAILVTNYYVGGFMLKSENVQGLTYEQLKRNNRRLLDYSRDVPLFISVDQEGGDVARLGNLIRTYPSPADLFRQRGEEGVYEQAEYVSKKLKDLHININFSPVIDRLTDSNSIVNGRAFSWNNVTNVNLANRCLEIYSGNEVIAVPKHFPGYGSVRNDPHFQVCRDTASALEELATPFDMLREPGMIMTAHIILARIDDRPATLSKTVIDYLRSRDKEVVIITDDIQMKAITDIYEYKIASLNALKAGCDIVLSITKNEGDWYDNAVALVEYLRDAYENGELTAETIDNSLARIMRLKLRYMPEEYWGALQNSERDFIGGLTGERSGG